MVRKGVGTSEESYYFIVMGHQSVSLTLCASVWRVGKVGIT